MRVITSNGEYRTDDVCQSEVQEQNIGPGRKIRELSILNLEIAFLDCEVARLEQIFWITKVLPTVENNSMKDNIVILSYKQNKLINHLDHKLINWITDIC